MSERKPSTAATDGDHAKGNQPGQRAVMHGVLPNATHAGRSNRDWWPHQPNLGILHQHRRPRTQWAGISTTPSSSSSSTTRR
jgi:catalase (peroxidase I)